MGCTGSKPLPPPPHGWGQSAELKALLVGGGDGNTSPAPSLKLSDMKGNTEIDGQLFGELIRAGFVQLYNNKDACNKINVFPVPDGDTGTNMCITLRPAIMSLGESPDKDIKKTSLLVSGQTTLNAQGNSGTIFSFTFSKLAAAIGKKAAGGKLPLADFVSCLGSVSTQMQKAMDNPVPGTMLTVIAAAFNEKNFNGLSTVGDVFAKAQQCGQVALEKTPDQLIVDGVAVLKNFRGKTVVDSGAQGFQYLLDGMASAFNGTLTYGEYLSPGTAADVALDEGAVGTSDVAVHDHENLRFKYCTECVGELRNGVSEDDLRSALNAPTSSGNKTGGQLGDSLGTLITKMSDTCSLAKIHIHSNEPEEVFSRIRKFTKDGHLYKEKSEDMALQVKYTKNPRTIANPDDANVGIVWSSCAGIPEDMGNVWIEGMVPLICTVNDQAYKDKKTITSLQFFNLMRRRDFERVGTSGWNVDDIGAAIKLKLAKHKEVLVISLPISFSKGTGNAYDNALSKLSKEDQQRVHYYKHRMISPPEGPVVMRAHWLASTQKELSAKQIATQLHDWQLSPDTFAGVYFHTLTYLRLGGRLAAKDKGVLKMIFDYIENNGKSFCWLSDFIKDDKDAPDRAQFLGPAQFTKNMGDEPKIVQQIVDYCIKKASSSKATQFDMQVDHAASPHDVEYMVEAIKSKVNIRNIYYSPMTAVLGVHGGPRIRAVFLWPSDEMEFPQSK
jgi:uncharacterized protein